MLGVPAGIFSALSYGAGDFAGAVAARRAGALAVVAGAHGVGFVTLIVVALVVPPAAPSTDGMLLGLVAGIAGAVGLAALYHGMSLGAMGLITAVSGVGSLVPPLLVGALLGTASSPLQLVGVACAAGAAIAASGATRSEAARRALLFGGLAAVALGGWYVLIDLAARESSPLWALLWTRASSAGLTGLFAIGRIDRARFPLGIVVVAGLFDIGGSALYVVARESLPIGLAAALTGLYPVATIILARVFLGETLSRRGQLGVALAVVGVILISLGAA